MNYYEQGAVATNGFDSFLSGMSVFMYIICITLSIIAMYRLFKMAGVSPAWKAVLPLFNVITLLKVINMRWWTIIFMFIPFINFIYYMVFSYKLAKSYNRGFGMTLALIICPPVAMLIMAFSSKTKYVR